MFPRALACPLRFVGLLFFTHTHPPVLSHHHSRRFANGACRVRARACAVGLSSLAQIRLTTRVFSFYVQTCIMISGNESDDVDNTRHLFWFSVPVLTCCGTSRIFFPSISPSKVAVIGREKKGQTTQPAHTHIYETVPRPIGAVRRSRGISPFLLLPRKKKGNYSVDAKQGAATSSFVEGR